MHYHDRFIDGTEFNARNANLTHTEGANRGGNTSKRVSIVSLTSHACLAVKLDKSAPSFLV